MTKIFSWKIIYKYTVDLSLSSIIILIIIIMQQISELLINPIDRIL